MNGNPDPIDAIPPGTTIPALPLPPPTIVTATPIPKAPPQHSPNTYSGGAPIVEPHRHPQPRSRRHVPPHEHVVPRRHR